jgi:transcription-repair coupling factor (superfamily II helicase)
MDYNELGGGFKLAMSDLQIRGGGNILGESQSGNIAAVGYDLYLDLLQKTIADLKDGSTNFQEDEFDPEVNLQLSAYIPENYITDTNQRYFAYRKIAALPTEGAILEMQEELRDRYGPLPDATINLLAIINLKLLMRKVRIDKLEQGSNSSLVFSFMADTPVSTATIMDFLKNHNSRFTPDNRLIVQPSKKNREDTLIRAKKLLHHFLQDASKI